MYPHSVLWHFLWIAPIFFQISIAIFLIRSNRFREFPAFLLYNLFQVVLRSTLFVLDHDPAVSAYAYWEVYWAGEIVSVVLRFAVIYEIFSNVFCVYPGVWELSRLLFRWAAAVLVLTGVAVSAFSPGQETVPLFTAIHLLSRAVSLLETGLLIFLFAFSSYFGLCWRNLAYGVGLGLGIFSSVNLASEALRVWAGPNARIFLYDFVPMGTYQVSVAIWLI